MSINACWCHNLNKLMYIFCIISDEEGEPSRGFRGLGLNDKDSSGCSPFADPSDPNKRRMSLNDFIFIKVLGKGSFGKVYKLFGKSL